MYDDSMTIHKEAGLIRGFSMNYHWDFYFKSLNMLIALLLVVVFL